MSDYLKSFVKFSKWFIVSLIIASLLLLISEGDLAVLSGIICFLGICFFWRAFYCIAWDIVEKKGYSEDEIPTSVIVLIDIFMGPLMFIYLMALPTNTNKETLNAEQKHDSIITTWTCSCGTVNHISTETCTKCKTSKTSSKKSVFSVNTWFCPECKESNSNSTRICKSCGYQK